MSSAAHPEQGVVVDVDATTAALNQLREPQELLQQAIGKLAEPSTLGNESENPISAPYSAFLQALSDAAHRANGEFARGHDGVSGIAHTPDLDHSAAVNVNTLSEKS